MKKQQIFENPNTLLEEDLNSLFKTKQSSDINLLFSLVNIILSKSQRNTDMVNLLSTVGMENFVKIIHLFDGRTITFPSDKELTDAIILAVCYQLKKVDGVTEWDDIQDWFGNYQIDRLSTALKLHSIDSFIKQKLQQFTKEQKGKKDEKR